MDFGFFGGFFLVKNWFANTPISQKVRLEHPNFDESTSKLRQWTNKFCGFQNFHQAKLTKKNGLQRVSTPQKHGFWWICQKSLFWTFTHGFCVPHPPKITCFSLLVTQQPTPTHFCDVLCFDPVDPVDPVLKWNPCILPTFYMIYKMTLKWVPRWVLVNFRNALTTY